MFEESISEYFIALKQNQQLHSAITLLFNKNKNTGYYNT